ncbi:hypothetical protein [Vibrio owensii]|uniref:hypothetical protein n=1 Tax=Vibrio owensii TaxID=696485 RepID=UPI0018F26934|nr:hypothetical protein [Vibrio owensii]
MLVFVGLYALSLIPLFFQKSEQFARVGLVGSSLALLVSGMTGAMLSVSVVVFLGALMLSRDLIYARLMTTYAVIADACRVDVRAVLATALFVSVGVALFLSPVLGRVADVLPQAFYLVIGVVGAAVGFFGVGRYSLRELGGKRSRVPAKIHRMGMICLLANTSLFFSRYMIMPLLFVEFAKLFGFEDSLFTYLGALIGVMTVISFLFNRRPSDGMYGVSMVVGVVIALLSTIIMSVLGIYLGGMHSAFALAAFLVALTGLEIANKIWSVNYFARLAKMSEGTPSTHENYKMYAKYKSLAGVVGFGIAFIVSAQMPLFYIGAALSSISIIGVLAIYLSSAED